MGGDGWFEQSDVITKWEAAAKATDDDGKTDAAIFGDAAIALISVFDLINGLGMAKKDMLGNANTVADFAKGNPGMSLHDLVEAEIAKELAAPKAKSKGEVVKELAKNGKKCTCAVLWLCRALTFIKEMLAALCSDPDKKMSECVNAGYELSLKPHHSFVVKGIFKAAVGSAPKRDKFLMSLLGDSVEADKVEEVAVAKFQLVLANLETVLKANGTYVESHGLKVFVKE